MVIEVEECRRPAIGEIPNALNRVEHARGGELHRLALRAYRELRSPDAASSLANQWKHRLFAKRETGSKDQCVGLVWNEARMQPKTTEAGKPFYRLEMTAPTNAMADPDFDSHAHYFDRWATTMKFSAGDGKTDVVLIPVHLKANVGGVVKTRKQRNVEAKMLTKALAKVRQEFHDDDIIILGTPTS